MDGVQGALTTMQEEQDSPIHALKKIQLLYDPCKPKKQEILRWINTYR